MAILTTYEEAAHTRRYALSITDGLARVLGSKGPFPPPMGEVALTIAAQITPAAIVFDPPLVLWAIRNASGFLILDGTYAREGSRGARLPLASGRYRVRVRGQYYQDLELDLDWPPADDDVRIPVNHELRPGPAYPFPAIAPATFAEPNTSAQNRPYSRGFTLIRGSVLGPAGERIVGAAAELVNFVVDPFPTMPSPPPWPFLRCVTSDTGDWAILLPDRLTFKNVAPTTTAPVIHPITVRVTYPDATFVDLPINVPLGTEFAVTQTALRGNVIDTRGLPIAGVSIATSAGSPASASRADGRWSLYFPLDQPDVPLVTVTATKPGGTPASSSVAIVHGKTVVVPTFVFA